MKKVVLYFHHEGMCEWRGWMRGRLLKSYLPEIQWECCSHLLLIWLLIIQSTHDYNTVAFCKILWLHLYLCNIILCLWWSLVPTLKGFTPKLSLQLDCLWLNTFLDTIWEWNPSLAVFISYRCNSHLTRSELLLQAGEFHISSLNRKESFHSIYTFFYILRLYLCSLLGSHQSTLS